MPTIVSDPTQGGFNCYVSRADAITILSGRLNVAAWDAASVDDKDRALLMATRWLDTYTTWTGQATVSTQNLSWPRAYVQIHDRPLGTFFANNIIPDIIKVATAEYASALLTNDLLSDEETGLSGVKVGTISVQFNKRDRKDPVPDTVKMLVAPYGTVSVAGSGTVRLVRM